MAKFNISSVVPGQVSDLQAKAAAEVAKTPVSQPEPQLSSFGDLLSPPQAAEIAGDAVTAGIEAEGALEDQRERERVQPIKDRYSDMQRVDVFDYDGGRKAKEAANDGPSSDGGLARRATNFANLIQSGELTFTGSKAHIPSNNQQILQKTRAYDETGAPHPDFLKIASVVTENTIADLAFNEGVKENITPQDEVTEVEIKGQNPISKTIGNQNLGQQIHREWSRARNQAEGRPTDEYTDLSGDEAIVLGDMAKELYYEANKQDAGKQFIVRNTTPDGTVAFQLTKHGADLLKEGSAKRKRLFPKQHVRPSKTPLPAGRFVGEGNTYRKRVSSKTREPLVGDQTLNHAMANLNKVANVVDKQRLKILLATAIPVLQGQVQPDHPFASMNHLGQDVVNKFQAKATKDPDFDAAQNYADLMNDLAQSIFGIANEVEGANHLTYYLQAATGRIAPQQTHFDPTTSKTVRFVTRNAVPAKAVPGSRIEKNLRQMYAMMLVKGADSALPAERDRLLERAAPQMVRWGKILRDKVSQIDDSLVQDVVDAVKNGMPVTDENFPQIPQLDVPADLAQAILDKGEDGQAYVDGLIDFTNYYEKKLKGQPHFSYFNAYMDGKTNGLASNGIQMGSEEVAYKTGVLRSQGKRLLDNDEDIRDALKNTLLEMVDQNGFDGDLDKFSNALAPIAAKIYSNRALNKSTTMTYGYGMEMGSFKRVIDDHLLEMEQGDGELASLVQQATANSSREEVVDALHSMYVGGLEQALDPNALASRGLMRSVAMLHALTNELFTLTTATGFELNIGGTSPEGYQEVGSYRVDGQRRYAGDITQRSTSAAPKRETDDEGNISVQPGGLAYGGSVTSPVQSMDAATVAMTASGRSWKRLENASNGNPYLHTIYDAFKVDAMGYDVVLDEVNKNWLKAGMDWSYLEEAKSSLDTLRKKWGEKMKGVPDNTPLEGDDWAMAGYLLQPVESRSGRMYPANLVNKLGKLLADPDQAYEVAMNIVNAMGKQGYNYLNPNQPTVKDLKNFIRLFSGSLDLDRRLGQMISTTNAKKKKLASKIKSDGHRVYQYYSH